MLHQPLQLCTYKYLQCTQPYNFGLIDERMHQYTVNIYRFKAIGANAASSVILYTGKCISPYLEILYLLQVILQPLQDYLQELKDFQTGANAFTGIQNYTGCCISPYSFVPINIYSVFTVNFSKIPLSQKFVLFFEMLDVLLQI